jgi:hypothetical protein
MALKDRLQRMALFPKLPDMDEIRQELEEKFQMIYGVLVEIRDELRTQKGAP